MEDLLPRKVESAEDLNQKFPGLLPKRTIADADFLSVNQGVLEPIYDLLDRGGKRWRPSMGLIFAECFGRDVTNFEANKDVYFACGLTELIHNGSLMMDDLQDQSQSRRGD